MTELVKGVYISYSILKNREAYQSMFIISVILLWSVSKGDMEILAKILSCVISRKLFNMIWSIKGIISTFHNLIPVDSALDLPFYGGGVGGHEHQKLFHDAELKAPAIQPFTPLLHCIAVIKSCLYSMMLTICLALFL